MSRSNRWLGRASRRSLLAMAAGSASLGLVNSVFAQNGGTWTYNGGEEWSETFPWLLEQIPDGIGAIAGFGAGGNNNIIDTLTVVLDTNRTVGVLQFDDSNSTTTPAGWLLRSSGGSVLTFAAVPEARPFIFVENLGVGNDQAAGTLFQKVAHISASIAGTDGFVRNGTGTLVLSGNNSGLSGEVNLLQGALVLTNANALGSATVTQLTGQLAFRNDTATAFGTDIVLQSDSTFGTGNSIGTQGLYGAGSNQVHTIGDVALTTYGVRTLGVSGSNGYGLNVGRLTLIDGINLINEGNNGSINGAGLNNNVNGLGSGALTVGTITYTGSGAGTIHFGGVGQYAGNITVSNPIENTNGGSAALVYSGDKILTLAGPITTGGDTYVTGSTTGSIAGGDFQAGVGTMIVNAGALPSNRAVTINGGTLVLNGGAVTHTVNGLTMGGATLLSGVVPAHMNLGSGTLGLGGSIVVNDSVTFTDVPNTVTAAIATAAGITGTVDLGGVNRSIAVNGTSTLTIEGQVTGTSGIVKSGTGALLLNGSGSNTFTGNIDIQDGMVSGNVRTSGNAFGAGSSVSSGGSLRLVGSNVAGTGTVSTLSIKDSGGHQGLIVDASLGGTTTLNINSFTGRGGTNATMKIVPVTGSLDTNEIVRIATGAPLAVNGILPAYIAVQNSGTNTGLGFAGIASNRITNFGAYAGGGINGAGITSVYDQVGSETLTGNKQVYALRIAGGASLDGSQILTLGDGVNGGGLIMNGGAMLNASTLTAQSNGEELVVWSGGGAVNTITSGISLLGNLTTGGAQELDLTGTLNFNGSARNITVTGGTTTLSGNSALNGGTGFVKRGGGVLAITGSNGIYSGTIGIEGGTLQVGAGDVTGGIGNGAITNNANLSFNKVDVLGSYSNPISGSGNVWIDSTDLGVISLGGPLSYTGKTTVQSGTLRSTANDRLPTAGHLQVDGGTFDLNGFNQTLATVGGLGTITAGSVVGSHTLTISGTTTFDGALRDGATGSLALAKVGPGTLVLGGANSLFTGTISVSGGALEIRHGNAAGDVAGNPGAGDAPIVLGNGTLIVNNENNRMIRRNILIPQGSTGTISVLSNPNPAGWSANFQNVQDNQNSINGFFNGGGTLVLDLNGRPLDIGTNGANTALFNGFTGTVIFPDSNEPGSKLRFAQGVANFTSANAAATFHFGSGYQTINFRNGTTTFATGYVSGGTNTVFTGCENGAGRSSFVQFGNLAGNQTFAGRVVDAGSPLIGGFSPMGMQKVGANSALTLHGVSDYSLVTPIQGGTLILGAGSDIRTSPTIDIGAVSTVAGVQTATLQFAGGTLTTEGQFVDIGAVVNTATQSISGALVVPNGFVSPAGTTFIGGGTIYGNLNHSAGSINPGTTGGFGTLTFANNLNLMAGGNIDFNVTNGSANVLGAGVNDMIRVLPSDGLSLDGGTIRVNFNQGTANLALNQYYPLIEFNGNVGGGGTASLQAFAALALTHGSLTMIQGSGSLANTIGARVDAVGGATFNLVWTPTQGNTWDIVSSRNFTPLGGGGGSLLFFNTDSVTFDDSTTLRDVVLAASAFQPDGVTINTDNVYTFTQKTVAAGSITGATNFVKNGSGTVFLSMGNSFTGGATINDGWIVQDVPNTAGVTRTPLGVQTITFNGDAGYRWIARTANANYGPDGNIGGGPITANAYFNGNNSIFIPADNAGAQNLNWNFHGNGTVNILKPVANGNMTLNGSLASFGGTIKVTDISPGGVLRFNSGGANNATGGPSVTMDLGNGVINLTHRNGGAPFTFGALRGGPGTQLSINGAGVLTVGMKEDSTFGGVITGNATSQVVKAGSFTTLTLTSLHTYTGQTIVNEGTLALVSDTGSNLASPTIIVNTAGVLDVNGLNFGNGMVLNANQTLISNGDVVGPQVTAVASSTIGGTKYNVPLVVSNNATVSPGNNNVASLTVSNLQLGSAFFTVEMDQNGIDSLVLSGTQVNPIVSAQSTLNLVNLGGFIPGTYTFLDYTGNPLDQFGIEFGFLPTETAYEVNVIHDTADTSVKLQFVNNSAQWFVNSNGTWSTANNWTLDGTNPSAIVPNSVTFGTFIQAPRTVNVNGTTGNIANSIVFDSPISYTIAGPGTLTMDSGVVAPITVIQGDHAINAPVRAIRTLGVSVPTATTLSFGGTITNSNNAGVNKIGSGTVSFTRLNMPGGTLNVGAGTVVMSPKGSPNSAEGTSLIGVLTIAAGANVDLTNNALIIDSNSNATVGAQLLELRAELADGRLFSSATTSETTLGYRSNNTGTTAAAGTGTAGVGLNTDTNFGGGTADGTSVLVRVTYKGDTNLDGIVNVLDLVNLALNWGSTNGVWAGGDFNYDGLVDATDLGILSQGWQLGNDNPLPSTDLGAALTSAGIPLSAIPEPGSLAILGAGSLGLLGRRRRRA